jgi:hypothetical protein
MTSPIRSSEHPTITLTKRLLGARKGPATETDRPVRTSRPARVIPGQLTIFEAMASSRNGDGEEER